MIYSCGEMYVVVTKIKLKKIKFFCQNFDLKRLVNQMGKKSPERKEKNE